MDQSTETGLYNGVSPNVFTYLVTIPQPFWNNVFYVQAKVVQWLFLPLGGATLALSG